MPFVTLAGGLTITHDIKKDMKDDKGNVVVEGNGFKPLKLGYGEHCDYNPNGKWFQQIVRRGTPDPKERHWVNGVNPVWRIPTEVITTNTKIDEYGEEYSETDHNSWLRILEFFELNKSQKDKLIFYEPDVEDVEVKKFGNKAGFHFPLWVLHELVAMGEFERAKVESLVNDPHTKKLDEDGYKYLLEAIANREKEEKHIDIDIDEENVIAERKKKKGDIARATGRKRQVREKAEAQKDAQLQARQEEMQKKAKEKMRKDGILS